MIFIFFFSLMMYKWIIIVYLNTPLHFACKSGNINIIKLLLNNNSKIYIKNLNSKTPFDLANFNNDKEIENLLNKN